MRTNEAEATQVLGQSGKANENAYPHCPFNKFFNPRTGRTILTYVLEKTEEVSKEKISPRQDRIRSGLRENSFRLAPFARTDEDEIRASGMDIESNGQVDWIAHRGYSTYTEPKDGSGLRLQVHLERAREVQGL